MARAEARARASRQGAFSIRGPSWRSATTSPASGRTRRSVALEVGPRVSSKHDHHQCRYRYHWLLVWFIPQPVLTLPSTSMRGNLALFTLASTIRIPFQPAPCSYVGTATVLLLPPHPGDWAETLLLGPSRFAWQSMVGRGNRQHVSPDQQYTGVLLWYLLVLLPAVCASVVFQLRVRPW